MQIPTLTQARRALLELMHAQRGTMPPQFAIISMYLDSQVPLNVENFDTNALSSLTDAGRKALNHVLNQPGMNDIVRTSITCDLQELDAATLANIRATLPTSKR